MSKEQKEKLRKVNLGRKDSEETKRKKSIALTKRIRKPISEETRKKMSDSHVGKPGYWTGKKRSEETKLKISKNSARIGYWTGKKRYKETIEKMSLANKGKKLSEETRKKISEALKRSYENGTRTKARNK